MEWIDSHTHLNYEYPFSVAEYIENAKKVGVTKFITIGTEPDTLDSLKDLAEKFPEVYFSVGIHPHEAKFYNNDVEEKMTSLVSHPKCVAVGEIGLDYWYDHSSPA